MLPPPFLKNLQVLGRRFYSLGYEAVDRLVGEKISVIPRPAKTTDPGVALLWVLGAERNGIS